LRIVYNINFGNKTDGKPNRFDLGYLQHIEYYRPTA